MKTTVTYNQDKNAIVIKDGINNWALMTNIIMVLNIMNALLRIFNKKTGQTEFYIWLTLGIISLLFLIYNLIYNSFLKEISLKNIDHLEIKHNHKRDVYSLFFKNGKRRKILVPKDNVKVLETIKNVNIEILIV